MWKRNFCCGNQLAAITRRERETYAMNHRNQGWMLKQKNRNSAQTQKMKYIFLF